MFEKRHPAFWKALTPDLMPDVTRPASSLLDSAVLAALGGAENITSKQKVALTRVRVQVCDASKLTLHAQQLPNVMPLANGVVHVLVGL